MFLSSGLKTSISIIDLYVAVFNSQIITYLRGLGYDMSLHFLQAQKTTHLPLILMHKVLRLGM